MIVRGSRRALDDARGRAIAASDRWSQVLCAYKLSPRERQVVELLLRGIEHDAQVAEQFGISPRTVHAHLERIYRKVDVNSRSRLIASLLLECLAASTTDQAPDINTRTQ